MLLGGREGRVEGDQLRVAVHEDGVEEALKRHPPSPHRGPASSMRPGCRGPSRRSRGRGSRQRARLQGAASAQNGTAAARRGRARSERRRRVVLREESEQRFAPSPPSTARRPASRPRRAAWRNPRRRWSRPASSATRTPLNCTSGKGMPPIGDRHVEPGLRHRLLRESRRASDDRRRAGAGRRRARASLMPPLQRDVEPADRGRAVLCHDERVRAAVAELVRRVFLIVQLAASA